MAKAPSVYTNMHGISRKSVAGDDLSILDRRAFSAYLACMRSTMKDRAYAHIRDKLLLGAIPVGDRVSDVEIARELGISRTPVREAIAHLEAEGLIEQQPGIGPRIKVL